MRVQAGAQEGASKSTDEGASRSSSTEKGGGYIDETTKCKVLGACVVPACVYGYIRLALTQRHDEKLHAAENSWS